MSKWRVLIDRVRSEWKIMGSNFFILSAVLAVSLVFIAILAGDLINVSCVEFEVIFPFYAAIGAGEWGRTKSDDNCEVIAAQSRSVVGWFAIRYAAVAGVVSLFAAAGMVMVWMIRREMPLAELMLAYFPTAFLLSSLSALFGLFSEKEHVASMACGVVWLAALMMRSLLRIPFVRYVYLFVRSAGVRDAAWIISKGILCICALAVWSVIYRTLKSVDIR